MVSLLKKYFTGLLLIMCIGLFSVVFTGCGGSSDAPVVIPAKAWGTAELIEADTGNAEYPQIAFDPDGNAIAVWEQRDNNGIMCIYSNRYDSTTGWGTAEDIDMTNFHAFEPQIGIDSYGNALVVWRQGTNNDIYSNRYDSTTGWGTPMRIESVNNPGNEPQIAINSDGNAIAIWTQDNQYVYSNRYDSGTGLWDTEVLIETDAGNADSPQVAIDPDGNAIAVWHQNNHDIYSNRYDSGTGLWGTAAEEIDDSGANQAAYPQVAIDPDGNAIVVWRQDDGTYDSIYSNRYTSGTGWGTAELIENNASAAYEPQIAIDPDGNAIAVWQQDDGTGTNNIYANRFE